MAKGPKGLGGNVAMGLVWIWCGLFDRLDCLAFLRHMYRMMAPSTTSPIPAPRVGKWISINWKPDEDSSDEFWMLLAPDFGSDVDCVPPITPSLVW